MILKTKEERIEFLKSLEMGYYHDFYMLKETDIDNPKYEIEQYRVQWAWTWVTHHNRCRQGEISLSEITFLGEANYDKQLLGQEAYKYVLDYLWADDKLELETETKKYKNAIEIRNSVLEELFNL